MEKIINKEFPVKYCSDCEQVFEIYGKTSIMYYEEFPTFGLERETCYNCNK